MNKEIDNTIDVFSNNLKIEFAENETGGKKYTKAIISMPLITVGVNKKNIHWTAEVLNGIADMFQGVVFKYDINGSQGSSHVPEHLYSPFYDVGWTYDDITGAYFDGTQLWIKGEVTNPEVVEKLSRKGANGKSELNSGSSGVLLNYNYVVCTICGKLATTCNHKRGTEYDGKIAGIKPISSKAVRRALHVALTNDPADGEANIKEILLQEARELFNLGEKKMEDRIEKKPEDTIEKKEEIVEKKDDVVETAESTDKKEIKEKTFVGQAKGLMTCPSCGHKFKAESASMGNIPAPKPANNIVDKGSKKDSDSESSTSYNRSKMDLQGRIESSDLLQVKLTKRVIKNIENQCSRLGRNMVETADMDLRQLETIESVLETTPSVKNNVQFDGQDNISGLGVPSNKVKSKEGLEFADMNDSQKSARISEVSEKYGNDAGIALSLGNMEYFNKVIQMNR